jgi:single-strand DNA-binding protein
MDAIAKIIRIENVEQISEKFKKRRIIVDYSKNPTYPQTVEFTLTQNNVGLADNLNPGDEIKLLFDLKGKEATDKNGKRMVFNSLEVWRIEVIKKSLDYMEPVNSNNSSDIYDDNDPLPF